MAKKTNKSSTLPIYVLPSDNKELQSFAIENKLDMMEQVILSIEFAVRWNLPLVEVFQFKNSDFVITISEKDFLVNLDNILTHYMKSETYEYCPRIVKLQNTIKQQIGQIINNEKK
jgi:hypothetical protein